MDDMRYALPHELHGDNAIVYRNTYVSNLSLLTPISTTFDQRLGANSILAHRSMKGKYVGAVPYMIRYATSVSS